MSPRQVSPAAVVRGDRRRVCTKRVWSPAPRVQYKKLETHENKLQLTLNSDTFMLRIDDSRCND